MKPLGPQAGREFPEGTSMRYPETARIVRAAPAGSYPSRLPRLTGIYGQSQSQAYLPVFHAYSFFSTDPAARLQSLAFRRIQP